MVNGSDLSGKVAFDANSLNALKQSAKENSPEAIKAVAKQFEAVLMNMMLKSMREANPQDGEFDNEQSRMFTSMLDQQLTNNLSTKGLGLADVLVRQLSKTTQTVTDAVSKEIEGTSATLHQKSEALINSFSSKDKPNPQQTSPIDSTQKDKKSEHHSGLGESISSFFDKMISHAKEASASTGMPTHLMLGQAALESGWGKREIKASDGTNSHNLFGIKATGNWKGKVVETMTTEYINGVKQKRIEKFRAYDNYADSFKDFANLIQNNPRFQNVIANIHSVERYANAMQKSGYATDPSYAKKLSNVIQKFASL